MCYLLSENEKDYVHTFMSYPIKGTRTTFNGGHVSFEHTK